MALLVALGSAASDGIPNNGVVDAVTTTAMYMDAVGGYTDAVHDRTKAVVPDGIPVPQAPIPNARPVAILIPALNVHRPIEAVGTDRWGYMYTPANAWDAGWYTGSPVPGAPGDALIEGHAGFPNKPLLFGKLQQLHRGDRIIIVLADGSKQIFLVQSMKVWPANTAPEGMGQPYGVPRLTLVTCTGPFDDKYKTYKDRLVLEATYAGVG